MAILDLFKNQDTQPLWKKVSLAEFRKQRSETIEPAKFAEEIFELYSVPSLETGKPEIVKGKEIGSNKQIVSFQDVLLSKINPRLNRSWLVQNFTKHKNIASTEWIVFEENSAILSKFLRYLLTQSVIRDFLAHNASGVGGSLTRVKPAIVDGIHFGLPPLAEQHRIVAKIEELFSELDKGVENLRTAQQQLKVYRQALLKHAFEGKLTADWRAQNPDKLEPADALLARIQQERGARYQQQLLDWKEAQQAWETSGKTGNKPRKPKALKTLPPLTTEELAELPELPPEWTWIHPEAIASPEDYAIGIGPFGSNLKVSDYRESGVPLIFVKNITRSDFSRDLKYIDHSKYLELTAHAVKPLDLVITKMGDPPGDCEIYPADAPEAVLTADCLKFRLWEDFANRLMYKNCINSTLVRKQLGLITKGVAQKKISVDRFKTICLPLMCIEEQKQIAQSLDEKFSLLDQLEQTITHSLQQAEALRQSILKKAFSGQLVAQDANDEPASVLLERIKAEKQAKPAAGKRPPRTAAAALPSNVVPMPTRIPGIASTDLHAGILALAYSAHEAEPKYLPYFGHVKGEKVSHLVEAHLGIELDRAPVKDAAGPNDYPHLKKVESRARKVGWFDMCREPGATAYSLHKLAGFNELQVKTRQALGTRLSEVETLLRLLLPLNTRQAEIVATLYAAWNNLLLAGYQPNDQQIIFEARDNWHPDKLKIEPWRFEKGLVWMRERELTPRGQGRRVEARRA